MKKLYFIYLIMLFSFNVFAQQDKNEHIELSGYIKYLNAFSFVDRLEQLEWTSLLHNRLNLKYTASKAILMRLEFRNRAFYGNGIKNTYGFSDLISYDNGMVDLSWNIIDNGNFILNTTIDRALINYTKAKWDITLGRQRVNWGINLVWNPNDIFNTYNFLEFDYEERPGCDAIRVQYYLGDFNKIELVAKKGKYSNDNNLAVMYKFNEWSYDIQFITGIYKKDWVIGTGWAGNLKNAGFKGEVSYFMPFESYLNSENVLSASISMDYGFKKGLYLNGSILYNSGVEKSSKSIENLLNTVLSPKYLMPYKFSGFLQLAKAFTPIFSGSASIMYSPTNQSVIIIPNIKYSLVDDWEIDVIGQSFFEFEDYNSLGNNLFIRLRWSF